MKLAVERGDMPDPEGRRYAPKIDWAQVGRLGGNPNPFKAKYVDTGLSKKQRKVLVNKGRLTRSTI